MQRQTKASLSSRIAGCSFPVLLLVNKCMLLTAIGIKNVCFRRWQTSPPLTFFQPAMPCAPLVLHYSFWNSCCGCNIFHGGFIIHHKSSINPGVAHQLVFIPYFSKSECSWEARCGGFNKLRMFASVIELRMSMVTTRSSSIFTLPSCPRILKTAAMAVNVFDTKGDVRGRCVWFASSLPGYIWFRYISQIRYSRFWPL